MSLRALIILAALALAVRAADPPPSDVLILNDGERLIGTVQQSSGAALKFKSNAIGEVTIDWSKVKELHSSRPFAVIPKHVHFGRHPDTSGVVEGPITVAGGQVQVSGPPGAAPRVVPVSDTADIIDAPAFEKAIHHHEGFLHDWTGNATGGVAMVLATQDSRTFTGAVSLVRVLPIENWLERVNRTSVNFNAAYGKVTQPGVPDLKTEIYHFDAEHDEYFSQRVYAFGQVAFDHNFSQGLDLQHNYGGGAGWTVIKNSATDLDLKLGASYIVQQLEHVPTANLIASTAAETLAHKFRRNITLVQQVSIIGTLNNRSAYSGSASATIVMPLYKRLNISFSTLDGFLNDPPPGFQKNSFQFTTGVAYALK
jgi:Protein of unknown function, DUF481